MPLYIAGVLVCLGLLPKAQAVNPPPDGGYPGGNTAEGQGALFFLTTGIRNSADGFFALFFDTTGSDNTAIGALALLANRDGVANTAVGSQALEDNTPSFTVQTGSHNTALGFQALRSNTQGFDNTALGSQALYSNSIGIDNTASGVQALFSNTRGTSNTATGALALFSNTTAFDNTAIGAAALRNNTEGTQNTATGENALSSVTTGRFNTADGAEALENSRGDGNTATGAGALQSSIAGGLNTADGYLALLNNHGDGSNTAIGAEALRQSTTGSFNTAIGYRALWQNITGQFNIALGSLAGAVTLGSYNIDIYNVGNASDSNTIRIGETFDAHNGTGHNRAFIAGIRGVTTGNDDAIPVVIDSAGQLGTISSSRRFKTNIQPMDKASEAVLSLKPVTFHYKNSKRRTSQFGLIAEDVAKVNPDLVVRDKDGEIYTVRYDAVNAMLLNEFLKEHRKVERLEAALGAVNERLKEQDAKIQKVSAQIEMGKRAPRVVLNNR